MRAAPYPPDEMPADLRALHDEMAAYVAEHLKGFVSMRTDRALVGPFPPMLRFPAFGRAAWSYTKALIDHSHLPKPAHEVAILATGAVFSSRYELYAHERVAEGAGLSPSKIATIAAGQRPADLTEQEQAAYDVAVALASGRQLPQSTYARAVRLFGEQQTAELIYLVGGYCLVSLLLNAYDISVPGREEGLPEG
ncbi:carboxymuconolactone decarboxylase family protein [Rhodopila sp.]|uniref:carboxymuconolactone decarboxylase family protein n=1 Tax=Rhodopila sp. TaxID=2480087 RepID=UPI003D0E203E